VVTSAEEDRFNWRLSLFVVVSASTVWLSLFVYSADASLLYVFLIAPIFCLSCLVLLVIAAIRKRPRRCLSMLFTVSAFLAISGVLLKNQGSLRPALRWVLWSHRYKSEVLAQAAPANGELKHIEDGAGHR